MTTSTIDPRQLFSTLHGTSEAGFAAIHTPVFHSPQGIPYLTAPGVVILSRPSVNTAGLAGFLDGFDPALNFSGYLDDPTALPDGAQLCKIAGQTCYMSFGPKRSRNADAKRYFDNLKSSGHGSVFEHANYSLLVYGISRSLTHELIRHRSGFGYCLTGDTLIYSNKGAEGKVDGMKKRRLDHLYTMTQTPHGRSRLKLLRLRCLDEQTGTFTTGKIKSIVCSGIKPVFTVKLSDEKTITTTKEHRFLTKNGWMPLEDIVGGLSISPSGIAFYGKVDAEIMVNGQPLYRDVNWLHEHYIARGSSQKGMAELADVSEHTIRAWIRKHGLQKQPGSWTVGVSPWNKGKRYQVIVKPSEAKRAKLREQKLAEKNPQWKRGTTKLGRKQEELNNATRPVERPKRLIPKPVTIVSITYAGEQMTYDIEMEGPNHNFVANGIITHNSQLSQRYVSGRMLRFVERPEYQTDDLLHTQFLQRIERAASEYATLSERLLEMQKGGSTILSAEARTDLRKKVQQTARSVLPNETETVMVVTGNVRAWRHVIEERSSSHAETEIRALAVRMFLCLNQSDPVLFDDYRVEQLLDGTYTVKSDFLKV